MVYFFSGISKATGYTWWNGEAMWKSMNLWSANNIFNADYTFLAENYYILIVMGWGVLFLEIFYALFIWIPKTRKICLFATLAMHMGIGLLLDLYFFAAFMMFWNVTAFYISKPLPELDLAKNFRLFSSRKAISNNIPVEV